MMMKLIRRGIPIAGIARRIGVTRQVVADFVGHYNNVRLHSAIGYVTPADKLAGKEQEIWNRRDHAIENAREMRRRKRQARASVA